MNISTKFCASFLLVAFLSHNGFMFAGEDNENAPKKKPDSLALVAAKSVAAGVSLAVMLDFMKETHEIPTNFITKKRFLTRKKILKHGPLTGCVLWTYGALGYTTYRLSKSAYKSFCSRFSNENSEEVEQK